MQQITLRKQRRAVVGGYGNLRGGGGKDCGCAKSDQANAIHRKRGAAPIRRLAPTHNKAAVAACIHRNILNGGWRRRGKHNGGGWPRPKPIDAGNANGIKRAGYGIRNNGVGGGCLRHRSAVVYKIAGNERGGIAIPTNCRRRHLSLRAPSICYVGKAQRARRSAGGNGICPSAGAV